MSLLQPHVENRLDPAADERPLVCGIIGDRPSEYAKSPSIWTAAFENLETNAIYLPFDVTERKLPGLVEALRSCPAYVGGNVTVPYKVTVMSMLDEVDPAAARIGAVNTIVKNNEGRLVGYNTDADGAVGSLLYPTPWQPESFLSNLDGLSVVLIGAGGAARATAFAVAAKLGAGHIAIVNRSGDKASRLAGAVSEAYGNATAIGQAALSDALKDADLVINSSVVGQSGTRKGVGDRITCLEPYSPLAPANPAEVPASNYSSDTAFYQQWYSASSEDINTNLKLSAELVQSSPPQAAFFDLIYSPLETTFLRQARLSGHSTLNGKGMNIIQAVEAFVHGVMLSQLEVQGWSPEEAYKRVFGAMMEVW